MALLDFGGGGTSITLADAASGFEPIEDTTRYTEFSGDQIDQALLNHVLEGITNAGGIDPAGTAAVGSLTRLREECRNAKERLSAETVTELIAELPGYRSGIRVTRAELESLIAQPLAGVLTALENALERNRISWSNVSAVVTIGGGASIPLITQQLSEHSQAPVVTTPQPALDAAVGAALFAAFGSDGRREDRRGAGSAGGCSPDPIDAPGSATFRALAWSQDDDTADDVVPYTGDLYDTGGTAARPPVQYVAADRADRGAPDDVESAAAVGVRVGRRGRGGRRRRGRGRADERDRQHQRHGATEAPPRRLPDPPAPHRRRRPHHLSRPSRSPASRHCRRRRRPRRRFRRR